MLYRRMDKTGDELSVLGFGCMRLPEVRGKINEERATRQLRDAIDRGVNYVDTAVFYHRGQSEPFVGRALRDGFRDRVKLATKLPPWSCKVPADMEGILNAQLRKLQTDRIDYYLLHALDAANWKTAEPLGVLPFLDQARRDGRIINPGFSFHGDFATFQTIVDAYEWSFCQLQYNFLDAAGEAGTAALEYAAEKGLGIIIMEPLRGGQLTGRIPAPVRRIYDQADTSRSPAEWALRWVWHRPEVSLVLSGMNDEAHIEENLRIAGEALPNSLSPSELGLVDRVAAKYRELMTIGCTGCGYCMPCPFGVDIPGCFDAYNQMHMFQDGKRARMVYAFRMGGVMGDGRTTLASQCQECGKCEQNCPQNIAIQDHLKVVAKEFEGFGMKLLTWGGRLFFWHQRRRNRRTP